jgi:hypothetical protein
MICGDVESHRGLAGVGSRDAGSSADGRLRGSWCASPGARHAEDGVPLGGLYTMRPYPEGGGDRPYLSGCPELPHSLDGQSDGERG